MPKTASSQHLEQARAHRAAGRLGKAEKAYRQAMRKAGAPAALELAEFLHQLGRDADGLPLVVDQIDRADTSLDDLILIASIARATGRHDVSLKAAMTATSRADAPAAAWFLRGSAELGLSDAMTAEQSLLKAVALEPDNLEYRAKAADAQVGRGSFPIPTEQAREMVDRDPATARNHARLGTALRLNDDLDGADACFDRALQCDRNCADALAGKAQILEQRGHTDEAVRLIRPFVFQSSPSFMITSAWVRLARRRRAWDEAESALRKYLASDRGLTLHHANFQMQLGQILERQGRFPEAFDAFTAGNAPHRGRWDAQAHERFVDAAITAFSAEAMSSLPRATSGDTRPIFVLGMYRSGTTLTETVLSAHPDVSPAGESGGITQCAGELADQLGSRDQWPAIVSEVTTAALDEAAQRYMAMLLAVAGTDAPHTVDKMPMNYLNLGLISLMFPDARIIHCVRDPIDTCLSCYGNAFAARMSYTADLGDLGRTYRQYARLMEHWSSVETIPVHVLRYEDLVSSPEPELRRVLEFLGLDWNPAILEFHTSKRVAATPSMDQVREPLYTASVGRAQGYGPLLDELRAALQG